MFMAADEFPLPYEYRFFQLDGLVSVIPEDVAERTVVFLDCGNIDRNPADVIKRDDAHILNIDHHHDNTHFGTVNHVVPEASCTAEIVWDLMRGLEGRAVAADRRGAVRRPGHRHRQVHVREHRDPRARHGRGADRRRRRRPRDLPSPVRGGSRTASSSCWRGGYRTSSATTAER